MEGNILGGQLALSPKFTYDSLNDDFGAELPLYLILDGDAPVLPGFKIGYASQENEVTFGLFLKASFSMSR